MEVIPDALAVVSLNTMYFFDSNKGLPSPPSLPFQSLTELITGIPLCDLDLAAQSPLTYSDGGPSPLYPHGDGVSAPASAQFNVRRGPQ